MSLLYRIGPFLANSSPARPKRTPILTCGKMPKPGPWRSRGLVPIEFSSLIALLSFWRRGVCYIAIVKLRQRRLAVAKTKHGPTLFDYLHLSEHAVAETPEIGVEFAPKSDHKTRVSPARTDVVPVASPEPSRPVGPANRPVTVGLDGDRLRFSLSSVGAAVVIFAAIAALFGAFVLGSGSGEKRGFSRGKIAGRESYTASTMSEIETVRSRPPATGVIESLLTEPAASSSSDDAGRGSAVRRDASADPQWIRDYTYVVVQEFRAGHTADAQDARDFLSHHGVSSEVVGFDSGAIQLITTQGFDRRQATQRGMAEALLAKVHDIGDKYFAAGGGYRMQGYFRRLKGDQW